jgi:hypothetical protein
VSDASKFSVGHCWAWCEECGAQACAYGMAPTLEHAAGCPAPQRKPSGRVTAVDLETGTVTYSGDDET